MKNIKNKMKVWTNVKPRKWRNMWSIKSNWITIDTFSNMSNRGVENHIERFVMGLSLLGKKG